ncbi:sialate:O-sulfotransferase 1-like [Ptychodera flava]|uniref:sialate:O-sulfotransferase 1-like n=1 Tax=Ptychodera flava TaxID=63121 RepID=UPI003969D774
MQMKLQGTVICSIIFTSCLMMFVYKMSPLATTTTTSEPAVTIQSLDNQADTTTEIVDVQAEVLYVEPESKCSLRLAPKGAFPITALACPPGVGCAWLRHLIEQATGFYTGSEYKDLTKAIKGHLGELEIWSDGTTLVVQTPRAEFRAPAGIREKFKAVILLLRNPNDLAIAVRNKAKGNTLTESEVFNSTLLSNDKWIQEVRWRGSLYEKFVNSWFGLNVPILVIHYENVREDPIREVTRAVKFLNLTVDENRIACAKESVEGYYHHDYSDKTKIYEQVLSPEMKTWATKVMRRVSDILVSHGQDPVPWGKLPPQTLPPPESGGQQEDKADSQDKAT